ncbi:hypothetical protein ACI8AC_23700 [Geodermatophilus sp. SYSU D00758]
MTSATCHAVGCASAATDGFFLSDGTPTPLCRPHLDFVAAGGPYDPTEDLAGILLKSHDDTGALVPMSAENVAALAHGHGT